MNNIYIATTRLLLLAIFIVAGLTVSFAADAVKFRVTLDTSVAGSSEQMSGRLLIFMRKDDGKPSDGFGIDYFDPNAVYICGNEMTGITPGKTIEINAETSAFPAAFSSAAEGDYQIFALLDRDHSYTYDGAGAGDVYSEVIKTKMPAADTSIRLIKVVPPHKLPEAANLKTVEFESPMLSAFWGRPIKMQATVALPPSYAKGGKGTYPTVYNIHGYGGSHFNPYYDAKQRDKDWAEGKRPEMIYVFLEAHHSLGHHVFADSANNGPWGSALVKEFIPYLEKRFRMDAKPSGRFLTGHSSGGWATLWAMVTHPDFFAGTWSTSPDPVDFRSFTGPDLTKYPPQNAYVDASGRDYNLVRTGGKDVMSYRQYAMQEAVLGYYGGQFASFNAVASPKGPDGQPMKLFDTETGRIDPFVQKAWEKYDISRMLRENWKTLGPKLKGKLHIYVGTADTFRLDESLRLLDAELKKLGSDARIEYLEGRDHFNLYQDGLPYKIANEMYASARPQAAKK